MKTFACIVLVALAVWAFPGVVLAGDLGQTVSTIESRYEQKYRAYQTFLDDRGERKQYTTGELEVTVEFLDGHSGSVEYSVVSPNDRHLTAAQLQRYFDAHGGRSSFQETHRETYKVALVSMDGNTYAQLRMGMHKQPTRVIFWTREFYNAYMRDERGKPFPGLEKTEATATHR
jgi:hypothetical protein